MDFGSEPSLDHDAELMTDRIAARMRDALGRVPLRSTFVDALGVEARPAIQALLFALSTDKAEDTSSLEHHETTAMIALLGRSFAFDGTTPTAAASIVPALLGAFRDEGLGVPSSLDEPLGVVFLEGYVRGREERVRAEGADRALESVALVRLAPRVGLVVIRGGHEPEPMVKRLESLAREAFAHELVVCVFDVALRESGEGALGPILHAIELFRSVGIEIVVTGVAPDLVQESTAKVCETSQDAVAHALSIAGMSLGRDGVIPRRLRELLRARVTSRRGTAQ